MAPPSSSSPAPELSSITTALDEITRRVTAIAERAYGTDQDWLASMLFDAERALTQASRRLSTATAALRERG